MSHKLFLIRVWLVLTILVISLAGTPAFAQGGATVRVDPAASTAQVNDRVELRVRVDNVANLTAFELHLAFDPAVLEVIEVTNGGFVAADFVAQNVFDNTAGTIDYAVAQMSKPAATGSGSLLNIAFRAKANGSSAIALRSTQAVQGGLLLSDENGIGIQASWADGVVRVGSPAAATVTPTAPATATVTATPAAPSAATATATATATRTATPAVTQPPTSTGRTHIVRSGENLFCIGRAYNIWPFAIADANGIWWPYVIYPNQKLTIPTTTWSSIPVGPVCAAQFTTSPTTPTPVTPVPPTATVTATPTKGTPVACRATYIVRRGDTLYRIAISYGTNYTALASANQIANARLIYVGQRLCIP